MNFNLQKIKYFFVILIFFIGCKNPFSPGFDENPGSVPTLSDLTTIEGVFKNFQYAYTFKDTIIYGQLINPQFIFTYRDYDESVDKSWGRDTEMRTTYGLFQNSQKLDLIWNNIILSSIDSSSASIVRSFNLTIVFNPTDVQRITGRVNMFLEKNENSKKWSITRWLDESDF